MASIEERVSRLEGPYNHLATRADLEEVKASIGDLRANIADLKAELTWRVAGLQFAGLAAVAAIMGFLR